MDQDKDGGPIGLVSSSNSASKIERHDCNEVKDAPKMQFGRNHRRNGFNDSKAFFAITFMMLFAICQAHSNVCVHRAEYKQPFCAPGQDIIVEHGLSIEVQCSGLDWNSANPLYRSCEVSDLEVLVNNKSVDAHELIRTNEHTLTLSLKKPPPSKFTFGCRRRIANIEGEQYMERNVQVFVGFKPRKPRSVKCLSYNWESIVCTWDPTPNYIPTKFSLRFELPGMEAANSSIACLPPREEDKLPPNSCVLPLYDESTNLYSKLTAENYIIALDAENVLGTECFTYNFHHWANVIPSHPVNLSVISTTPSSALLHWDIPSRLCKFPPGLHYRVAYKNPWDGQGNNWHFQTIDVTNPTHNTEVYFNLTNLESSNTVYYVRVFMRSSLAVDEDMWGQFSDIIFKTPATLPCSPPKTDIGSFEVVMNSYSRDVYVYWQTIPTYLENTDHFPYQIVQVEENGSKMHLRPQEVTKTYAKFTNLSFNSFKFEIAGTNCKGADNPTSTVIVPSHLETPLKPVLFTKIAYGNGAYELSWNPSDSLDIMSYTIFWCENDRDRPYQCSGYLDWVKVPGDASIYRMTVPNPHKVYQFAISSNTAHASTGMVWFSGMTTFSSVYGKVKSVRITDIEIDMAVVEWDLECSDRLKNVKGVNLYYCPVQSPLDLDCKGLRMKSTVLAEEHVTQSAIRGLKPFTSYMITVAVFSELTGDGFVSDPVFFTTLETAPSPPQNVVVTRMTDMTVSVEWQPPVAMNGILRYYAVYYDWELMTKVERGTRVELTDVKTVNGFCVSVAACTILCTKSSATCIEPRNHTLPLPWLR